MQTLERPHARAMLMPTYAFAAVAIATMVFANHASSIRPGLEPEPVDLLAGVRTIALSGNQAPGTSDGEVFGGFRMFSMNQSGQVAIHATLEGPNVDSNNDTGVWSNSLGALGKLARSGELIPGFPTGSKFKLHYSYPEINAAGDTAFHASLSGGSIWVGTPGAIELEVGSNEILVGTPGDLPLSGFGQTSGSRFHFDSDGDVTFLGLGQIGERSDRVIYSGIWSKIGETLVPHVVGGQPAAGINDAMLTDVQRFSINESGNLIYVADYEGQGFEGQGLWSQTAGNTGLVAKSGDIAPTPVGDAEFESFISTWGPASLSENGNFAFHARVSGDVGNAEHGVWARVNGQLELIAHGPAPGLGGSHIFSILRSGNRPSSDPFTLPVVNDAGLVAFSAFTRDFASSENGQGVWVWRSGVLEPLLVSGTNQEQNNPVADLSANATFGGFGLPAINAAGQVAFFGRFNDGTLDSEDAIFALNRHGELVIVVQQGQAIEVAPGDTRTIAALYLPTPNVEGEGGRTWLNDNGEIAFRARFEDGSSGIFVTSAVAIPEPTTIVGFSLALAVAAGARRWQTSRRGR